jgi:putative transposase
VAQIVEILGQAEASDTTVADVCRLNGISDNALLCWRRRHGDMQVSEVRRLRELGSYLASQTPADARHCQILIQR